MITNKDDVSLYKELIDANSELDQPTYMDVVNKIVSKIKRFSETKFLSYYEPSLEKKGSASKWVLPDGRLLEFEFHQSLTEYIFVKLFDEYCVKHDYNYNKTFEDHIHAYEFGRLNDFIVKKFNWLKFNDGSYLDICYAIIPDKVTSKQLRVFEELLEQTAKLEYNPMFNHPGKNTGSILILDSKYHQKLYSFNMYSPSDIIKSVRKFTASSIFEKYKRK